MERIEHLVGIADALRTSYPRNACMASICMNKVIDPARWFANGGRPSVAAGRS
jgi:hypothetical protein